MTETESSSNFSRDEGAPVTKEDWDALSPEEKLFWEQSRRRRRFLRRHGHRAKGLAQIVNPQDRTLPSAGRVRGRGHLRRKRLIPDRPVQTPTPEQLADKPGLEPIRPIPDSGKYGPSGLSHINDLRLIRRAQRERWKIPEVACSDIPDTLNRIINANEDSNPVLAIQAINTFTKMMAQNQADEHEEVKRASLTKEQAADLVAHIIETLRSEVDDPAVRQKIASSLGTKLMALGIVSAGTRPVDPPDTPAHPNVVYQD